MTCPPPVPSSSSRHIDLYHAVGQPRRGSRNPGRPKPAGSSPWRRPGRRSSLLHASRRKLPRRSTTATELPMPWLSLAVRWSAWKPARSVHVRTSFRPLACLSKWSWADRAERLRQTAGALLTLEKRFKGRAAEGEAGFAEWKDREASAQATDRQPALCAPPPSHYRPTALSFPHHRTIPLRLPFPPPIRPSQQILLSLRLRSAPPPVRGSPPPPARTSVRSARMPP